MSLTDQQTKELKLKANSIRQDIIKMLLEAKSGHSGGSLGMADIFTALYFHVLKHDAKNPGWVDRDRVVLSNGHICPVLYATLSLAGYFPHEELMTLRKLGSRLQGHPHRESLPGLETTSGPLGSGLSQAAGMALAGKMNNANWQVYCLVSDGEHDEGNTWEAVMFAAKYKLHNLIAIMDRNNIQIDGNTEDIMPLEPVRAKYESFGWYVIEINGHDFIEIIEALNKAKTIHDRPTMIIAHTIPGRGVSFMENRYEWHGSPPNLADVSGAPPKQQQAEIALKELEEIRTKIESNKYD